MVSSHSHDHEHQEKRQHHFEHKRARERYAGDCRCGPDIRSNQTPQQERTGCCPAQLCDGVRDDFTAGKPPTEPESCRDRGVEVGARDVAQGVDARQDDEREAQGDADVRHRSLSMQVHGRGAGTDHHQHERADSFGQEPRSVHLIGRVS